MDFIGLKQKSHHQTVAMGLSLAAEARDGIAHQEPGRRFAPCSGRAETASCRRAIRRLQSEFVCFKVQSERRLIPLS